MNQELLTSIEGKTARVVVLGLGYEGGRGEATFDGIGRGTGELVQRGEGIAAGGE